MVDLHASLLIPLTYCVTCSVGKKFCIGKIVRKSAHRFREHLSDVEKNDKDASN